MGKAKIRMLDRIDINPDFINPCADKYNNWIGHEGTVIVFTGDKKNGSHAVLKFDEGKPFGTSTILDITLEDGILKLETLNTVYVLEIISGYEYLFSKKDGMAINIFGFLL